MRSDAKRPTARTNHRLKQSGALAIAALVAMATLVASAFASQEVIDYFGNASGSGSGGGEFNNPRQIGVNSSGAGPADAGDVYVADDNNNRVQRFDKDGNFISAWGADVANPPGGSDFEICTEAAECKAGVATGGNETAAGNGTLDNPQAVAVDNDTGQVYVSDRDNRRVNVYDGAGSFLRSFGWDVAESGPGNTGAEYEICIAVEGDVCKKGVGASSPGVGQFHTSTTSGAYGIAVSPADGEASVGKVFLANSGARRVETYNLDGTSPANFGSSAEFGSNQPRDLAADSRGVLYASNSSGGARVERYDTEDANGEGVGFLEPIVPYQNETQKLAFSGFAGGNEFTLTCPNGETTDPIAWASLGSSIKPNVETALNAKCGQSFSVSSSSSPVVTFEGNFAGTDVPTMTCTTTEGSGTCSISQEIDGVPGPLLPGGGTATAGLAVDPDSDGGGSDVDELYVLRDSSSGPTVVQQLGPVNEPGLTVAPGEVDDTHGSLAGFSTVQGLGLDNQSGRLLVSSTSDALGLGSGHRVYVLDDPEAVPDAVATLDPVTVKSDTTATFSGTVDPMGTYTTCVFQYATDAEFAGATEVVEPQCPSLAKGGGPQAVSEEVAGLVPNTTYFVRLRTFHPFIGTSASTAPKPFATDSVPPFVTDVGAVQVTDTSARLAGTISPNNSATGYVFEYGKTPALGQSTAPLAIGDGTEPVAVSRVVKGLSKDTDYYFRLVAANAFGTTPSNQATFHTRAVPLPNPANRAYELVSPANKNGGDAISSENNIALTRTFAGYDGSGVAFESVNAFAEDPAAQIEFVNAWYASRRSSNGWRTRTVDPPNCANDPTDPGNLVVLGGAQPFVSANVEAAAIYQHEAASCASLPLDPEAILPATNLYRADLTAKPAGYDLLAPEADLALSSGIEVKHAYYAAGSDDYGHIVYRSGAQQTPGAPAGNFNKLYEWDDGTLRLVSVDPSGEPFETSSNVTSGSARFGPTGNTPLGINGGQPDVHNAVSADGERILFQNPTGSGVFGDCTSTCKLYMREGGTVTHHVSESECTSECGSGAAKVFRWADLEGDVVTFTSAERLTNDDPTGAGSGDEDLFVYRHSANPSVEANLTLASKDSEPADGTGDVLGVMGVGDDGDAVYFIAESQLVAGAPTGLGDQNVYRWEWNEGSPTLSYLTTVAQDSQVLPEVNVFGEDAHIERRVSRDGSALMIETSKRLLPAADTDGDHDVYMWRVGRGWTCASCQVPGEASGGRSTTGRLGYTHFATISELKSGLHTELSSAISEDGERVFFQTQDSLVPADVNGPCVLETQNGYYYPCTDVYEWHDGRVSLISTGDGALDMGLFGISESGRDVYFYTREKLVGWDKDELIDVYDARIGGGFPEPAPQPPACEGEGCREEGTEAPAIAGAGSAVFQGAGNPKSETPGSSCPANKLRRGKRCLSLRAVARRRCRRLSGQAKRRCVAKQTRRLRRAQRRRAQRRHNARAANTYRRATR